jgi:cobalt-zinc-cadmium efflux system protein
MMIYPLPILDPIMAIGVAVWVIWNAFKNLRETIKVFLQASPDQVQISAVTEKIKSMKWVKDIHHLHLWSMDGTHHVLTTHLIVEAAANQEDVHTLKGEIKKSLFAEFHITEATIEIEWPHQHCADPAH